MGKFDVVAPLFQTDAYKLDHRRQYGLAGNVTRVYSNYTNRKSRIPGVEHVVHFGLQAYLQQLADSFEPFFDARFSNVQRLYRERLTQILGANTADAIGTKHIEALWELDYLPLRFCAVPEGTLVPIGVPSFTVENTHPDFAWLTNFVETGLSVGVWQASTSATIAHEYRKILESAALRTNGDIAAVALQCHDFSYRGMSSQESAAVSGAAHLLSFLGTDSLVSLDWIEDHYGGEFTAVAVPATEHSVMCTGIESVGEQETFSRLLDLYPSGVVSVVSDTFDLWKVLRVYLPALKDKVLARNGKLVIRPDSGDPQKILLGDMDAPKGSPAYSGVLNMLYDTFDGHRDDDGFVHLSPKVGAIYGDSITLDRAKSITDEMERLRWASTNVVFGVGSFTYQYNTRDTFGSAMKATWAEVDGKPVNLLKDPITDDGTKKSATGRLAVHRDHGELVLLQNARELEERTSLLRPVWEDGNFLRTQDFDNVRNVLNG